MSNYYKRDFPSNRNDQTRQTNDRINTRNMGEISMMNNINRKKRDEINRLDIERDEFMRQSSNSKNDDISEAPSRDFGEFKNPGITYDRGMPHRPDVEFKGNNFAQNYLQTNDFNLLVNKSIGKKLNSYDRPNNYADIDSDTKLTEHVQDKSICVNGINNYGIFLFNNLNQIMRQPFIFSPLMIYSIFGSIYLGSDGNTQVELKNYFNFPRNDTLTSGLNYIMDLFSNTKIPNGNCIIFADNIDHNQEFCKYINNFTKIRKVNTNNAEKEAENINEIISQLIKTGIKKSIVKDNLINCDVLFLNYASINPIWINVFNPNYIKDIFNSKYQGKIQHNFMIARNETFGYYDTPYYQVLEMKSINNVSFGIILGDIEFTQKLFDSLILNLKATTLAQVKIPVLKIQTKLRYTNIMKQTDLKTVFLDLNVPELFTSTCKLDDVIQNIEIIIDRNIGASKTNGINARIKTVKEFNADITFTYYLRQTDTNCILFVGSY